MESASDISMDWHQAKALLEWYVELGAVDAIGDTPVNCYELAQEAPKPAALQTRASKAGPPAAAPNASVASAPDAKEAKGAQTAELVAQATALAAKANSLSALRDALEGWDAFPLKRGARQFVFSDGIPGARVMVLGEMPGPEEERAGVPFSGASGALLDKMLAAIGRDRTSEAPGAAVYLANTLPYQPPARRSPTADEIDMIRPIVARHIELAEPDVVILMGNIACQAMWKRSGILRMRGTWGEAAGRPAIAMAHPGYLLKTPAAKREAWADLLAVQAKLKQG
ncbi:MAG: uracil-DNA glycosylase [Maritimibacter sp.]